MPWRLILAFTLLGACEKPDSPQPPPEPASAPTQTRVPDGLEPEPEPEAPTKESKAKAPDVLEGFRIQFDSEKDANLTDAQNATLDQLAQHLTEHADLKIEIQGHADPKDMDCQYAICLSERRALLARDRLAAQGVDPGRIIVKGYDATMPLRPSDTDADRKFNRRLDFKPLP